MEQNRRSFIHLSLLTSGAYFMGKTTDANAEASTSQDLNAIQTAADKIRPLFEKMKPTQASDWLATQHEAGQTFLEYRQSHPSDIASQRTKLYLQPLGKLSEMEQSAVDKLRDLMRIFFDKEVILNEPISLAGILFHFQDHSHKLHHQCQTPTQTIRSTA